MPVPAVAALADAPTARVMGVVDGQNLHRRCKALYGHPSWHPHLLAEYLAGPRTVHRVACRFYTGVPSPNGPGERTKRRNIDRRLAGMRKVGVTVVARRLRYHDAWGIDDHQRRPIILEGLDHAHPVPRAVFERIAERTDYTVDDDLWTPVETPRSWADIG